MRWIFEIFMEVIQTIVIERRLNHQSQCESEQHEDSDSIDAGTGMPKILRDELKVLNAR